MEDGWLTFSVPGIPQGKGRPRATKARRKPYTPAKTVVYERDVRTGFLLGIQAASGKPMAGEGSLYGREAVEAEITAYYPIPKSATKTRQRLISTGAILPTVKPDADNVAKAVLDALNHLAYDDDSQVAILTVRKEFCRAGEERVEVRMRPATRT
jgi:Holliday junction resolvase RusA-like endonuclease